MHEKTSTASKKIRADVLMILTFHFLCSGKFTQRRDIAKLRSELSEQCYLENKKPSYPFTSATRLSLGFIGYFAKAVLPAILLKHLAN